MRLPTREQKAKENAVLYTLGADVTIVSLVFIFALLTQSLTLIGELWRMALMLSVDFYSIFILCAVHRQRLHKFRFGIGKLERICHLAIGAGLLVGGLWVAHRVVDTLLFGQVAASPLGLAAAAVVNAINTLINALGWLAMSAAARSDDSAIYRAHLRARLVALFCSLVVQTTLTIAALAKDPAIAIWLDGAGAAFVVCIMTAIGLEMMRESVPHLLDHPIPEHAKRRIGQALQAAGVKPEELVRIRSRRSGSLAHVELTLAPARGLSVADFKQRVGHLQRMIESRLQEADLAILIDTGNRVNAGIETSSSVRQGSTSDRPKLQAAPRSDRDIEGTLASTRAPT